MKSSALTLIIFLFCGVALSQNNNPPPGKPVSSPASVDALISGALHDTCLGKKFSIVFYIPNDSLFSLPANTTAMQSYSLSQVISRLNTAFSRICVEFEHCKTVIIPIYSYHRWVANTFGEQVTTTYFTENTINIYIPDSLDPLRPDEPELSYTFPPSTNSLIPHRNALIIQKRVLKGPSLMHAFGHFFGLPHTSAEINPGNMPSPGPPPGVTSYEYADHGNFSNCAIHGDGFCDTEADPYPQGGNLIGSRLNCAPAAIKDGQGNYYALPFENYMSFYADCRCKYSQEQYNFMARYIVANRMYLH